MDQYTKKINELLNFKFTILSTVRVDSSKCRYRIESVEAEGKQVQGCSHPKNDSIICQFYLCPKKSKCEIK